jgi:hypothetical protein
MICVLRGSLERLSRAPGHRALQPSYILYSGCLVLRLSLLTEICSHMLPPWWGGVDSTATSPINTHQPAWGQSPRHPGLRSEVYPVWSYPLLLA